MKKMPILSLLLLLGYGLFGQPLQHATVYFESDQYQLSSEALQVLQKLVVDVTNLEDYQVRIIAHTDDQGSTSYNHQLASRRAMSVQHFLQKAGILVQKTTVKSMGELDPVYSNTDETGRSRNRRVEVIVEGLYLESLQDLFGEISDYGDQNYQIRGDQHVKLVGQQGTTVWIDAGSFLGADGMPVQGAIDITLRETYDLNDIMAAGLSTSSGEQLLETGGMIYVQASANGQAVQLKPGTELLIGMPAALQEEGMELFYADTDPNEAVQDWVPTGSAFTNKVEDLLRLPDAPRQPYIPFIAPEYEPDLSGKPIPPAKPKEPVEPKLQSPGSYNPGVFKRIFMGKKEIDRRNEERQASAITNYEMRQARYEVEMRNHEKELALHQQRLKEHEIAVQQWEDSLEEEARKYRPDGVIYEAAKEEHRRYFEKKMEDYKKQRALWEEVCEKRVQEFEQKYEIVGNLSNQSLTGYFNKINTMGWINCDRFYNVPASEKLPLVIDDSNSESDETIYVVFRDIQSMMRAYRSGDQYLVQNLPKGQEVTVIGVKLEEGRPQMAVVDTQVGSTGSLALDYQACSLNDLRATLNRLN